MAGKLRLNTRGSAWTGVGQWKNMYVAVCARGLAFSLQFSHKQRQAETKGASWESAATAHVEENHCTGAVAAGQMWKIF